MPVLAGALKDPDDSVRRHAADALGNIGPVAVEAVPAASRNFAISYGIVPTILPTMLVGNISVDPKPNPYLNRPTGCPGGFR